MRSTPMRLAPLRSALLKITLLRFALPRSALLRSAPYKSLNNKVCPLKLRLPRCLKINTFTLSRCPWSRDSSSPNYVLWNDLDIGQTMLDIFSVTSAQACKTTIKLSSTLRACRDDSLKVGRLINSIGTPLRNSNPISLQSVSCQLEAFSILDSRISFSMNLKRYSSNAEGPHTFIQRTRAARSSQPLSTSS